MIVEKALYSWATFHKLPVVGILRNVSMGELITILPLYERAGLTTIEITMNTPGAADMIRFASECYAHRLNVGAGTVCNVDDLEKAVSCGAQFIVTPLVDEKVLHACREKNLPVFPGAFTASEIYKAWALGASMVKLFPANAVGTQYIKEIKGPFNQIQLLPTGGVSADNCLDFFEAGAAGVGMGGQLFDRNMIAEKRWNTLEMHFEDIAKKIRTRKY